MNKIDLIIDALESAHHTNDTGVMGLTKSRLEEALAAARELKALKPVGYMDSKGVLFNETTHPHLHTALYPLEVALAQPEQEPVAWMQDSTELYVNDRPTSIYKIPLYTAPPKRERESISTNDHLCAMLRQVHDVLACTALPMKRPWVGLTDEEILSAAEEVPITCIRQRDYDLHFAPITEAKLKEKNNAV